MAFPRSACLLLLLAAPAAAQQPPAPTPVPAPTVAVDHAAWLYRGSDIPPDPAWQFGTLPNGLRYAVRRNGVPPGQVAVRVRIDAGSLEETDGQRGYAHLIEHLSFRGSAYVPDGEAKRTWQRFGATFGSDSNAQTTPIATLYKLDLPSATPATLDESLKILSGMMAQPAITQGALDAERPVVLAEQREAPGPQVRLGDAINALFFAGQPLADRSPIGLVPVIEAATPASVRAYHDRWYRPERAVVIIAGDIDPALAASLVVKNFAGWRGVGAAPPADPDFGTPTPDAPVAAAVVEPGLPVLVTAATIRPWHFNADTVIFNQRRLVDQLATRIISRRLEERARAGASFLQAGVSVEDVARSANVTALQIVPAGGDWRAALRDVRGVVARATAAAPTQAEVDREYAEVAGVMRTEAETARVEAGARQADDMAGALDIRETVTTPQASYDILRGAHNKGMFTAAAVLASTRRLFRGTATRALVSLHAAEPDARAKLAAALTAPVGAAPARIAGTRAAAVLPPFAAPGLVTSRRAVPGFTMEQVEFANGTRLMVRSTDSETGRVYVRVRFGGGYGALPADPPSLAWAGDEALMASGIQGPKGLVGQDDLDRLTAGKTVGLQFGIAEDAFTIAGLTTPADYPDQLALIAAKLEHPAWDPAPVARARAGALAALSGRDDSPAAVLGHELEAKLRGGDPRWAEPATPAAVAALTPAAFRSLWEPLLASGPVEVSVFGDVKADDVVAAVARTFGAMRPRTFAPAGVPARFPAHVAAPLVLTHEGAANQAAAVIAWPTTGGTADVAEARPLEVLAQVFSDRLFDRLRSAAGASYSPQVASQWPLADNAGGGRLVAIGQVPPDKTGFFFTLAREIAADLAARPVSDDELRRELLPMQQLFLRQATGNLYWLRQLGGAAYDPRRYAAAAAIPADLARVTPASLQALAAKYLRPDRDWTMVVMPKGAK